MWIKIKITWRIYVNCMFYESIREIWNSYVCRVGKWKLAKVQCEKQAAKKENLTFGKNTYIDQRPSAQMYSIKKKYLNIRNVGQSCNSLLNNKKKKLKDKDIWSKYNIYYIYTYIHIHTSYICIHTYIRTYIIKTSSIKIACPRLSQSLSAAVTVRSVPFALLALMTSFGVFSSFS